MQEIAFHWQHQMSILKFRVPKLESAVAVMIIAGDLDDRQQGNTQHVRTASIAGGFAPGSFAAIEVDVLSVTPMQGKDWNILTLPSSFVQVLCGQI